MVKRIGSFKGDPILINLDAASEIVAETWLKKTDLANNALGQSLDRLNRVEAPNLKGIEPFYKRYPQLYPGLKPGSIPTAQQNRQLVRPVEELLFDAGYTTGADVGKAEPLRRGVSGYNMLSGTAIEESDKLYPPKMRFTQYFRDAVDNIMNRRDALREWKEWSEESLRMAAEKAEKQRKTQRVASATAKDIAHSIKGHKLSVNWLAAGLKGFILPDAIKKIKAGTGRIDFDDPVGVLDQTAEEYETKSKLHKDRSPGRPSNRVTINLDDDAAPRIPLGDEKPVSTKATKKALAKTSYNWDVDFNYEPTESEARARAVQPTTKIRYQVRRSIVDSWNDALGKMQHYGDKEGRNFKKILLNEVHKNEKALGIPLDLRTSQPELYDALDLAERKKLLKQDETIKAGKRKGKAPSNLHDGEVSRYVRPTENGRNRKNIETLFKINDKEDLIIARSTYSTGKDPATGKPKGESTAKNFAKQMTKYGLKGLGPIVGAIGALFIDPDPLEANPSTVGRMLTGAVEGITPLPLLASPVARAQLTDRYTPEELKQMRIEGEIGRTMSPDERRSEDEAFRDIERHTLDGFLTYEPDDRFHFRPPQP